MKKLLVIAVACGLGFASIPSHAINHAFRAKLERSGCTQVTEANGTCDPNKTKAQNHKASTKTTLKEATSLADQLVDMSISAAAEKLLAAGWKPNNGDWHKGGYIIRLIVEDDDVVNAQVTK